MAKAFTSPERALMRSGALKLRWLFTFRLDDGDYRFCDDAEDITCGGDTFTGASALTSALDIKSASGLASESVTLVVDGTRLNQVGFTDPAALFRDILALKLHQRRVDIEIGMGAIDELDFSIRKPAYAGKINAVRVVDGKQDLSASAMDPSVGNLEVTLDSLSSRYSRVTGRTRSHADQQDIDPTDMFFSFIQGLSQTNSDIYWGKTGPSGQTGLATSGTPYGGSTINGVNFAAGSINVGNHTLNY